MPSTTDTLRVTETAKIANLELTNGLARQYLREEALTVFPQNLGDAKVWDSGQPLSATPASDDLGYVVGTWATHVPYLSAGDLKAAGATTRRCLFFIRLPENYVAAGDVRLRFSAGMKTTIADVSCTVDAEAYLIARDGLISGSDLVSTAATTMNSVTFADKDFTITATALEPCDTLAVRVSIACNDAATVTAVTPAIGAVDLVCDVKG